jgi:hypothetical protein
VIANILYFIASFPLIKMVLRNKKVIKDYSIMGSVFTLAALVLTVSSLALMENWLAVVLCVPTVILWFLIFIYSISVRT